MRVYSLHGPIQGRVRHSPQTGGRCEYAGLEFVATPDRGVETIAIDCEPDAGDDLRCWLPSIRAGVAYRLQWHRERGEVVRGVRVCVTRVNTHPIDTTPLVMEKAGGQLFDQVFAHCEPVQ